jgi:hypothetical protein
MSDGPTIIGETTYQPSSRIFAGSPEALAASEQAERMIRGYRVRGFTELQLEELEEVGPQLLRGQGRPGVGAGAGRGAVRPLPGGGCVRRRGRRYGRFWFRPALPPLPMTWAEVERRERKRERAQATQKREAETELRMRQAAARTVTLNDYERDLPGTLRGALERLALLGGTCTIADKRLLVQLPTGEVRHDGLGGGPGFSLRLAAYLYRAEAALVEAMKGGTARLTRPGFLSGRSHRAAHWRERGCVPGAAGHGARGPAWKGWASRAGGMCTAPSKSATGTRSVSRSSAATTGTATCATRAAGHAGRRRRGRPCSTANRAWCSGRTPRARPAGILLVRARKPPTR